MLPGIIGFLVSFGLLGIAIVLIRKKKKFLDIAETGVGEVIDIQKDESQSTDENGNTTTSVTYRPIVRFSDELGNKHEFRATVGSGNRRKYEVGQTVQVLYDPMKPQKAILNNKMELWLLPGILMICSVIIFLFGFVPFMIDVLNRI